MISSLIEAALRSVLVALAVWGGLRAFRVSNVLAQKMAWGLVLAAAVFMPMLLPVAARWQALPATATVVLPSIRYRCWPDSVPQRSLSLRLPRQSMNSLRLRLPCRLLTQQRIIPRPVPIFPLPPFPGTPLLFSRSPSCSVVLSLRSRWDG